MLFYHFILCCVIMLCYDVLSLCYHYFLSFSDFFKFKIILKYFCPTKPFLGFVKVNKQIRVLLCIVLKNSKFLPYWQFYLALIRDYFEFLVASFVVRIKQNNWFSVYSCISTTFICLDLFSLGYSIWPLYWVICIL